MLNLNVYDGDAFAFHNKIIESKRNTKDDPQFKQRLLSYNGIIQEQFEKYNENYNNGCIESISGLNLSTKEKMDLLSLYSYKSKVIQELKIKLTTNQYNRVVSTCQNCTIGEVNSFDHILPKEVFAEFVVHPKNLFPSCTKCNSFKLNSWLSGNKRLFLNLFLDELPSEQYLFVDVKVSSENFETNFTTKNINKISEDKYELIASHYKRLRLCQRFSENAAEVISSLTHSIRPYVNLVSIDDVIGATKTKIAQDKLAFGNNYWKSILELTLIENEEYQKMLFHS